MKKLLLTFLVTIGAFSSTLSAKQIAIDQVVKLDDLPPEAFIAALSYSKSESEKMHGIAIEVSKNTLLPLKLFIKGDLIRLNEFESKDLSIEVLQKFYISVDGGDLVFSFDLKEFKPILEFITGNIVADVKPSNDGLVLGIQGDFNIRR
jgi:hypothetical protein